MKIFNYTIEVIVNPNKEILLLVTQLHDSEKDFYGSSNTIYPKSRIGNLPTTPFSGHVVAENIDSAKNLLFEELPKMANIVETQLINN